jgi:hypothetical protein
MPSRRSLGSTTPLPHRPERRSPPSSLHTGVLFYTMPLAQINAATHRVDGLLPPHWRPKSEPDPRLQEQCLANPRFRERRPTLTSSKNAATASSLKQ